MLTSINVAIGAMIGTILATSPAFTIRSFSDLGLAAFFSLLLVLQGWNIWLATKSMAAAEYDLFTCSVFAFLFVQAAVFTYFTMDASASRPGTEAVTFVFSERSYAWSYLLISSLWFVSNAAGAWLTKSTD
jgi:hypothetical protein